VDNVVHFEIPANNLDRAQKFYFNTFGWNIKPDERVEYNHVITGEMDSDNMPKKSGFINGGMPKKTRLLKHPIIVIGVNDLDLSLANVVKNDGIIVSKKQRVADMGYVAYIKDTEGNTVGLWQSIKK
jgi:uncharacterized protein